MLAYLRKGNEDEIAIVVVNFTPVPRQDYRVGVPHKGGYVEVLNSDSSYYGGSNMGNGDGVMQAEELPWMNRPILHYRATPGRHRTTPGGGFEPIRIGRKTGWGLPPHEFGPYY